MTSAAAFGLSQIGQIAVNVHDTGRAVAFYRDQLGIRFLFSAGQLAFFDAGGIRLMLTPPEKPEFDHLSSILYFKVPDIKQAHATLTERGVKFEDAPHMIARMPDHELWMTHFRDSENNLLSLMSEVRP
jgi:predicted enzyme related to lactoylglutathione lyase